MLEFAGVAGIFLVLLAFFLNNLKWFRRFTYVYNGLNFIGAALLAYHAITIRSLVFAVLNSLWMYIAAFFIIKKLSTGKPLRELGWEIEDDLEEMSGTRVQKPKPKPARKRQRQVKKAETGKEKGKETSTTWPWS